MKQRIISALIAIPLFLLLLFFAPAWLFKTFCLVAIGLTAYEAGKMFDFATRQSNLWIYVGVNIALAAPLLFAQAAMPKVATGILWLCLILWLFAIPYILTAYQKNGGATLVKKDYYLALLCTLFHLGFAVAIVRLHQAFAGQGLLGLLILIWASDAGAYFIGKKIGKTPFSPKISPNKTWEGFIGGLLLALLCALLWLFVFSEQLLFVSIGAKMLFLVCSIIALIYGALGDLYESLLKRRAGVKDSGQIMPGHGGIYDRIDSWLPALVIWAVMLQLLS